MVNCTYRGHAQQEFSEWKENGKLFPDHVQNRLLVNLIEGILAVHLANNERGISF
jgi:hypothetical protein